MTDFQKKMKLFKKCPFMSAFSVILFILGTETRQFHNKYSFLYGMAAGYHSPVAVSGSDGNACKVVLQRDLQRPSLFFFIGILYIAPAAGSLLHGHVTAISKSVAEDWKPSSNRHNGACGLQVWKVAQLVEQETIPSPRFDSWLSNSPKWRP